MAQTRAHSEQHGISASMINKISTKANKTTVYKHARTHAHEDSSERQLTEVLQNHCTCIMYCG